VNEILIAGATACPSVPSENIGISRGHMNLNFRFVNTAMPALRRLSHCPHLPCNRPPFDSIPSNHEQ
jgi:hypothetical protein